MFLINDCCTTISDHFFANCMFIFHKTEVQTVIFRCLMGLNLDWFKIYGLWYKRRPRTCLANFQKIVIDKWSFYYHIWPFFASCVLIFHKTEIQTVILRYLTSPNHNWYKSYDTKRKNVKKANACFCTKLQNTENGNIYTLCHKLRTNQILGLLSTPKWSSEPQFCERWTYSWRKNGQK